MNNFHALSNGNGHIEQKSSVENVAAERACQNYWGGANFPPYTAISRKVVGKSARDNPERHCGWFWVLCSSKKFERIGTNGHGKVFSSAKGKQQK